MGVRGDLSSDVLTCRHYRIPCQRVIRSHSVIMIEVDFYSIGLNSHTAVSIVNTDHIQAVCQWTVTSTTCASLENPKRICFGPELELMWDNCDALQGLCIMCIKRTTCLPETHVVLDGIFDETIWVKSLS